MGIVGLLVGIVGLLVGMITLLRVAALAGIVASIYRFHLCRSNLGTPERRATRPVVLLPGLGDIDRLTGALDIRAAGFGGRSGRFGGAGERCGQGGRDLQRGRGAALRSCPEADAACGEGERGG